MRRIGIFLSLLLAFASLVRADDRDGIVLIVNRAAPESRALAEEYCGLRGIPYDRICELDLPTGESISRAEYESRLRDPLLDWLRRHGWIDQIKRDPRRVRPHESAWTTVKSRVRILCSFYGVPVRIEDTRPWLIEKVQNWIHHSPQRDEAAVDSELALVLHAPYDIKGRVGNPCYGDLKWDHTGAIGLFAVMAVRLDGPNPDVVRRMMRDAWETEKRGLLGRMYFDLRRTSLETYRLGDFWISESAERFAREGYDCIIEPSESVFGPDDPVDEAALYWGWYTDHATGPFTRTNFSFRPGAIAYHLHSFNAKRLRTTNEYWIGPLLAAGAAASWGSVSEPFLGATPNLSILADRLCRGMTFAESVYLAMPVLSWQITVVGDPLYRPFAVPVAEQIRRLEERDDPDTDWAVHRHINQMVQAGRFLLAMDVARRRLAQRESVVLHEKVAELWAINDRLDDAAPHFERAIELADRPETALRIGARYLALLRAAGQDDHADKFERQLRDRWRGSPFLVLLTRKPLLP